MYLRDNLKSIVKYFYSTREGRENIKYICEKYGVDKKQITKLKLKI